MTSPARGSFALSVFLVLLAAVAWGCDPKPTGLPSPDPERPVEGLGRLEPATGIIDIGVPGGDRLGEVCVQEGDWVNKGKELARLASYDLRKEEIDLADIQMREAEARRDTIRTSFERQEEELDLRIRQARHASAEEINAQKEKIGLLQMKLKNAKKERERIERLQDPSTIPDQDRERQQLLVKQARVDLSLAKKQLATLEEKNDLALLEAQRNALEAKKRAAEGEVPLDSARKNLALARKRLSQSVISAPQYGQILKILTRPGEMLGPRPILRLGDTRQMVAVAEVYMTDGDRLRARLRRSPPPSATIRSPALAPDYLTGTVDPLGNVVQKNREFDLDPAASADRRVIEVRIRVHETERAAQFVNLPVEVAIRLED
jgi:HlyD family secretion protein